MDSLKVQVGGDHYKKYKIQPVEYSYANKLDFFQGEVVKYITRFRDKGQEKDLDKIIHLVQVLKQLEYPKKNVLGLTVPEYPLGIPTGAVDAGFQPSPVPALSSSASLLLSGEPPDSLGTPIREPSACR